MPDTFIALDVETANSWYGSICQIGLVRSEGGRCTQEWNFLINPQTYFDSFNVAIHGIDEETVKGAPTLEKVWDEILSIVAEHPVAHHGPFDRASLNQATQAGGLISPDFRWLDTTRIVRRHWQDRSRSGYGLKPVCEMLGFNFAHHNAVADARAAAFILNHVIIESGENLEWWFDQSARKVGAITERSYKFTQTLEGDPNGALAGETVVFTGALSLPRKEIAAIATTHGCNVASSVSKETTILVVGEQPSWKLTGHDKSSKQRKAEELVAGGRSIRIMGEQGFIAALELAQANGN